MNTPPPPPNVYRLDIMVVATVYVKATSQNDARRKIKAYIKETPDIEVDGEEISGARFDSPNLPNVSLSPAMALIGFFDNGQDPELVQ